MVPDYIVGSVERERFVNGERGLPDNEDRRSAHIGKHIMRIDVKKDGEALVLAYMITFISQVLIR
jgi:hypothetical protein